MTFDIILLSEEELSAFSVIQLKLLRTAQQKKDALRHQLEMDLQTYKSILYGNNAYLSSLYSDKKTQLTAEYNYQVEILREQLIFNMSLNEPTGDGETGEGDSDVGDSPYLIDYGLSYLERYIQVRDYYMTIPDPVERLALYDADDVALAYLDGYYNTLYDYLSTFTH